MAAIRSFRDLEVYRRAVGEAKRIFVRIFVMTKRFPSEERYSLTDQIRRSSRAVSGMIAEAWAHRRYPAAFRSKLVDAMGEASETQAWLDHSVACEYIIDAEYAELDDAWQQIGAMVNGMIERTDDFCRSVAP